MILEQLIEKKRQYNNLLDKLDIILKNINNSVDEINNMIDHYHDSYIIDEEITDRNVLLNTKENLNKIIKNIETIKIKVNSKIKYLSTEINNCDSIDSESSNNSFSNNSNRKSNSKSKDMNLLN